MDAERPCRRDDDLKWLLIVRDSILVDLVGIEPTTSSMPWKRAPKLRHRPTCCKDATLLFSLLKQVSSNHARQINPESIPAGESPKAHSIHEVCRDREHFGWGPVSKTMGVRKNESCISGFRLPRFTAVKGFRRLSIAGQCRTGLGSLFGAPGESGHVPKMRPLR